MIEVKGVTVFNIPGLILAVFVVTSAHASDSQFVLDRGEAVSLLSARHTSDETVLIALGELAFKDEGLLDLAASRSVGIHLSCDSCHPDGGASQTIFLAGLSSKPGTIDITHRAITLYEDGIFNPVSIPSLLGARETGPYGRTGKFSTLRDFTRFAIVDEFGGKEPGELTVEALIAYQASLEFLTNEWIDDQGQLTDLASSTARRGYEVFNRPFPSDPQLSCSFCHIPEHAFIDGQTHEVGTGLKTDTPTLRDLRITPPYMHDGRFDSLAAVVAHFDGHFELSFTEKDKIALLAYLELVGGGVAVKPAMPKNFKIELIWVLLERTLLSKDWALGKMVIDQISRELNAIRGQPGAPVNEIINRCIDDLGQIDSFNKVENYKNSLDILYELRAALTR